MLPDELIATHPAHPKDSSRLLVYERAKNSVTHTVFKNILEFIPSDYALIFNNSKVIKARLNGHKKSGAKIELLFLKSLKDGYLVQIRGKVKEGSELFFEDGLKAVVLRLNGDGTRIVTFFKDSEELLPSELLAELEKIGTVPLPPYIKREVQKCDEHDYQSVFAKEYGSVAAPTASLHFTPELFERATTRHKSAFVTLHVGSGTFLPVSSENILEHAMHSEYYEISKEAIELIGSHTKILTIGSTATRCVEEYARSKKASGECSLFLHPQNRPIRIDAMLTNFHLPKSTLLMLVASILGVQKTKELYDIAIKERYRFFSYGDAMLII